MKRTFWLRFETKDNERRTALSPKNAKRLIDLGHKVIVEKFPERIFSDAEYEELGCELREAYSWKNSHKDDFILGLKELPEEDFDLTANHIYFAHAYKGQEGAEALIRRFKNGGGKLLDLEYLLDEAGRRVSAFGHWAGFVGAAIALDHFYSINHEYEHLHSFENQNDFVDQINTKKQNANKHPKVIIIGSKGRSGQGAYHLLKEIGLDATLWDFEETKKGGPFSEILEHDIFINCVLIRNKIPPFINLEIIKKQHSNLKVISDVSCDPTGPYNPIPICNQSTTWEKPFLKHELGIDILSIDNLPSILPRESSIDFSDQLIPHLISLGEEGIGAGVWSTALAHYNEFTSPLF